MKLRYVPEKNTKGTIRFKQEGWPQVNGSFYVPKPILEEEGVDVPDTPTEDEAAFLPENLPNVALRVNFEIVPQDEG